MKINEVTQKTEEQIIQEGLFDFITDIFRSADEKSRRAVLKKAEILAKYANRSWSDKVNAIKTANAASGSLEGISDQEYKEQLSDYIQQEILKGATPTPASKARIDAQIAKMAVLKDNPKQAATIMPSVMVAAIAAQIDRSGKTLDQVVQGNQQGQNQQDQKQQGQNQQDTAKKGETPAPTQPIPQGVTINIVNNTGQAEPAVVVGKGSQPDTVKVDTASGTKEVPRDETKIIADPLPNGTPVQFISKDGEVIDAEVVGPSKDGDPAKVSINSGKQDYNISKEKLLDPKSKKPVVIGTKPTPVEKTADEIQAEPAQQPDKKPEPTVDANKDGKDDKTGEPVATQPTDKETQKQEKVKFDLERVIGPSMKNQIDRLNAADKEALLKALTGKAKMRAAQ